MMADPRRHVCPIATQSNVESATAKVLVYDARRLPGRRPRRRSTPRHTERPSGALQRAAWRDRLYRLPLSFATSDRRVAGRSRPGRISQAELHRVRGILETSDSALTLARREWPATFVDVVHNGSTFTRLFDLLRSWIEREGEPWQVIRRKLPFIDVTSQTKTSPKTFRWQQHADWTTACRPGRRSTCRSTSSSGRTSAIVRVKLTRTFRTRDWLAGQGGPQRGERTAAALAPVEFGRSAAGRWAPGRGNRSRAVDGGSMAASFPPATDLTGSAPWLRSDSSRQQRKRSPWTRVRGHATADEVLADVQLVDTLKKLIDDGKVKQLDHGQ